MLESTIGATVNGKYAGSLSEVTFECGSSRGKTKSSSYYGVGLSFNYGPGYSLKNNPTGNLVETAALTKYKLLVLQASVVESKPALHKLTYKVLKALVDTAIKLHDRKKYQAALISVRLFLYLSNAVSYAVIPNENYNGEHQMRGSNIEFMYTSSILPLLK
jgi:hypothetical protein